MRASFALALCSIALGAGCSTRPCKSGTALVNVSFGSASSADSVLVSASIDGGATVSGTYPHHAGDKSGAVELDFSSYPAGHELTVTVGALSGNVIVASDTVGVTLAPGCTSLSVTLAGGGGDSDLGTDGGRGMVRQVGQSCQAGDVCVGSSCVDGFCCTSACTDACAACDVPGSEGTCTVVPAGAPHAGHSCGGMSSGACAATCDGVSTTTCTFPTTTCGAAPSCSNGIGTLAGMCSNGTCNQSMMACADKLCGATACQGVAQIAAGSQFTCALITDGTVRCWGKNKNGELGLGTADTNNHPTPAPVPGLTNVIYLAAGDNHACAVLADHSLKCWGFNGDGELGIGVADNVAHPTPMPVCATGTGGSCVPLTGVNKVAGSPVNTCAIVGQTVKCWGDNAMGQIGDGTTSTNTVNASRYNPTQVCTGPTACGNPIGSVNGGIVEIAMGWYHICALDGQGNVFCWGSNGAGECGLPSNNPTQENFPQPISGINVGSQKPIHISSGGYTVCAVVSDGVAANNLVRCWGFGGGGERGDSSTNTSNTPGSVCKIAGCGQLVTGATAIAGGNVGFCAVVGGAVDCWGSNGVGQLGIGTADTGQHLIATPSLITTGALDVASEADNDFFCARLQTGGAMRCWGFNGDGEIGEGDVVTPQPTPVAQKW